MQSAGSQLECGMMFFSASAESTEADKYAVVVEAAKYGDRHGFSSIWVPERHFTLLGGLYPNPSVLQAALAMVTERIQLRAGSVVLPLHNPLRVVEEWAMVDNLSRGRAGISFASGWHPTDFTFFPDRYEGRQDALFSAIPVVQKLWRGEKVSVKNGTGQDVEVAVFPRPIQKSLPTWITAAGNPQTFERVGASGANLLTHLLDQGTEALAAKIALYRKARAEHGHDPNAGHVSIMIHSFLGADAQVARETARRPFCDFLKLNAGLLNGLAKARGGRDIDFNRLSATDQEDFVQFIYQRFVGSRAFIGSPETCLPLARDLHAAGVDELLFLLDFGPAYGDILAGLPHLARLKELCQSGEHVPARPMSLQTGAAGSSSIGEAKVEEGLQQARARCSSTMNGREFRERLAARGVEVHGAELLVALSSGPAEALAQLNWPPASEVDGADAQALLFELCAQASIHALTGAATDSTAGVFLPSGVDGLDAASLVPGVIWAHARVANPSSASDRVAATIRLFDGAGESVGDGRITLQRVSPQPPTASSAAHAGQYLHEVEWQPQTLPVALPQPSSWLVLVDDQGVGEALVAKLTERGERCVIVRRPHAGGDQQRAGKLLDEVAGFRAALRELAKDHPPLRGVIQLWGLDTTPNSATTSATLESDAQHTLGGTIALMRALGEMDATSAKLWLITRGSQRVEKADDSGTVAFGQAPIWGLGCAFSSEHRQLFGGLVDIDSRSAAQDAATDVLKALDHVQADGREDMLAFRGGQAWVPRLLPRHEELGDKVQLRSDASYLVTGGLGGIGQVIAEWAVQKGAKHLVLLSRQAMPPREAWDAIDGGRWAGAVSLLRRLEAVGASVSVAAVDVGDEQAFEAFLALHRVSGLPPIRGVFHAAGTLQPKRLTQLDLEDLRQAFQAKVQGTWHLHQAFSSSELDLFVTFSSAPPHLGVLGQSLAAYNAANSFMDALVDYRVFLGRPALNIKWGPWAEVGLHAESSAKANLERLAAFGLRGMSNQEGMRVLEHLLAQGVHQRWALAANWPRLFESDFLISGKPFFGSVGAAQADLDETMHLHRQRAAFVAELGTLPAKARQLRLVSQLRELVVEVMRLDPQAVDWRRGLFDMGMDSLMALELKTKLQNRVGISISATLAFDYPTVDAIVGYLESQLFTGASHSEPIEVAAPASPSLSEEQLNALNESELEAALLAKLEAL